MYTMWLNIKCLQAVVAHAFNPSSVEAEAGLQSEFQDSQGYTCLEKLKKKKSVRIKDLSKTDEILFHFCEIRKHISYL